MDLGLGALISIAVVFLCFLPNWVYLRLHCQSRNHPCRGSIFEVQDSWLGHLISKGNFLLKMFQLKGWRPQLRGSLRYMHVINMRLYVNVCDRLYSCTRYSCRVHRSWNLFRVMEDQQKRQRASLVEEESVDLEEQLQADCDLSVHVDGLGWGMKLWCGSCRSFENSDIPNHIIQCHLQSL